MSAVASTIDCLGLSPAHCANRIDPGRESWHPPRFSMTRSAATPVPPSGLLEFPSGIPDLSEWRTSFCNRAANSSYPALDPTSFCVRKDRPVIENIAWNATGRVAEMVGAMVIPDFPAIAGTHSIPMRKHPHLGGLSASRLFRSRAGLNLDIPRATPSGCPDLF